MKVHLKRNLFTPTQELHYASRSPVELDDDLIGHLPPDARIDGLTVEQTRAKVAAARKAQGLGKPSPNAGEADPDGDLDLTATEDDSDDDDK